MKTETQPTAKHAEGEWNVFNAFARFEIREKEDDRQNIAEVYDEAKAARIVKCVNNEWKIDMHDELIEAMKELRSAAVSNNDFDCDSRLQDAAERAEYLLKQAEQK